MDIDIEALDLAASVGKEAKETFLEGTRSAKRARKSRETRGSWVWLSEKEDVFWLKVDGWCERDGRSVLDVYFVGDFAISYKELLVVLNSVVLVCVSGEDKDSAPVSSFWFTDDIADDGIEIASL